jgi:hypothetical protein
MSTTVLFTMGCDRAGASTFGGPEIRRRDRSPPTSLTDASSSTVALLSLTVAAMALAPLVRGARTVVVVAGVAKAAVAAAVAVAVVVVVAAVGLCLLLRCVWLVGLSVEIPEARLVL